MGVYLGHVQTVAGRLSVESLADMTLHWMHSKKLLENPSTVILSGFNEGSIDSVVQIVSRVVVAYFIYPRISPIVSLINGTIGVVHLGIGFTERFRTTETPDAQPDNWNRIAKNVHKGFVHILIAVYDFGIGFLLRQKYFDIGGVSFFASVPVVAFLWHQRVFKKPQEEVIVSPTKLQEHNGKLIEIAQQYIPDAQMQLIKQGLAGLVPAEVPPSPQVATDYLERTCLVYVIAKKITLELMPPRGVVQPLSILTRAINVGKRVSGIGVAEPIPDYGL